MSTIQSDFDRIALVSPDGSLHNQHYSEFLLRQVRPNCQAALEIGCGKGEFSRRLAERSARVLALDLSPEMIRIARANSASQSNIEFQIADVTTYDCRRKVLIASPVSRRCITCRSVRCFAK